MPSLARLSGMRVHTAAEAIASHIMAAEVAIVGAAPVKGTADQAVGAEGAKGAVGGYSRFDGGCTMKPLVRVCQKKQKGEANSCRTMKV